MSDYIKREDAIKANDEYVPYQRLGEDRKSYMDRVLKELPFADVVEVVRCKDCKWYNLNKWAEVDGVQIIVGHEICDFWGGGCKTQKNGYCSYGERKEK